MSIVSSISGLFHHTPPQPTRNTQTAQTVQTAQTTTPSGGGLVSSLGLDFHSASMGGMVSKVGTWGHLANDIATGYQGGTAVAAPAAGVIQAAKGFQLGGIFSGMKAVASAAMPFAKRSALIEGGISALTNGYRLIKGEESLSTFGGNVTGDTLGGLVGGAGGAVTSGIAISALGLFGVTGGLATVAGVVAGLVGYSLAEKVFKNTRIYHDIVGMVKSAL